MSDETKERVGHLCPEATGWLDPTASSPGVSESSSSTRNWHWRGCTRMTSRAIVALVDRGFLHRRFRRGLGRC